MVKNNIENIGMFNNWLDLTNRINTNLIENIQEQKNEYELIFGNWMMLSNDVAAELEKTVTEEEINYKHQYNVWKNYTNIIINHMTNMSNNGNNLFEKFINLVSEQSEHIANQYIGLNEKGEPITDSIYWSWQDLNKRFNEQMLRVISGNYPEFEELTNIRSEVYDKLINIMDLSIKENKLAIENFSKKWTEIVNTQQENLENLFFDYLKESDNLRNTYSYQLVNINKRIADIIKTISSDYEKMFRSYLKHTASFREGMDIFSNLHTQSLSVEVEELKKTVKQLKNRMTKLAK